jgi:dolichol-phosphate mannosyltransferase
LKITVVTPTYNEAENLPKLVSALFTLPLELRVLVVDDNSPDGTGAIADVLARQHPHRVRVLHRAGKLGLRTAYLEGFASALETDADAVVQMDADFSHDPTELAAMAERLASCDVVLGSRYVSGGSVDVRWPHWRRGLSAFGNFYARTILGLPLRDVTTGYRMWKRATLEGMYSLWRWPISRTFLNIKLARCRFILQTVVGENQRCRSRSRPRRRRASGRCYGSAATCEGWGNRRERVSP